MKLKCAIVPDQHPDSFKNLCGCFYLLCERISIEISVMQFTRGRCLTRLVRVFSANFWTLGPLDPWTLGPLSSWRLILLDSSHDDSIPPFRKINDEWWYTKVCHRSVYVVKNVVICQLHPPNYLYSVRIGCVIVVSASSFARNCLNFDPSRKQFNFMKLRYSSANNCTCLKGLARNNQWLTPV